MEKQLLRNILLFLSNLRDGQVETDMRQHQNIKWLSWNDWIFYFFILFCILFWILKCQCIIFTDKKKKWKCHQEEMSIYKSMAFQSLGDHHPLPQLSCYQLLKWNPIHLEAALLTSPGAQNPRCGSWWGAGRGGGAGVAGTKSQGGLLGRCQEKDFPS